MSLTKQIEKLCHEASEEKDSKKLLSLVDQLNKELARMSEASDNTGVPHSSNSASDEQKTKTSNAA